MNGRHFPFLLYWEHKRAREENQEEKENMEEAIRMLSSALAFQVIKNQELETRLEIVEERLLQTAAA